MSAFGLEKAEGARAAVGAEPAGWLVEPFRLAAPYFVREMPDAAEGGFVQALYRAADVENIVGKVFDVLVNRPEIDDFRLGVALEAAHQRDRWGSDHDSGKTPFDWFWLIGYLAGKAAAAAVAGDREKALHHTISTAAALANWHLALLGADTGMRPGVGAEVAA